MNLRMDKMFANRTISYSFHYNFGNVNSKIRNKNIKGSKYWKIKRIVVKCLISMCICKIAWRHKLKRFIRDFKKYWNYMVYEAKSQLKAEVANSYLNWIWWILEPFCLMLIYAFVFGFLFKHKEDHYNVFIFTALALWDNFNRCIKASVTIVKRNKSIISKVYLPKYALIISNMMVNTFKMFICLLIVFGMLAFYHIPVDWHVIEIIPIIANMLIFTFGCCCILSHMGVFIEDMSNVINIVLRFMFYLTGIFYNIGTSIPKPYSTILLSGNPIALFVDALRNCILVHSSPNWILMLIWFVIGCVLSAFGIANIYKHENTYVKVI